MKAQGTIAALCAFLILSLTFGSCKKDKHDKKATCKLVKVTQKSATGMAVITMAYNNDGKIAAIGVNSPLGNTTRTFTYTGNTINIVNTGNSGSRKDSVTLNANGRPTNIRSYQDTAGISWINQSFEYNGNQLAKVHQTDNSSTSTHTSVATYNNGNIVSLVTGPSISLMEYYTDRNIQAGDYLEFAFTLTYGVPIYPNKNLVKSIGSGSNLTTFIYDFDADGKITKVLLSSGNNVTELNYEYECR
jgi:hypothetical protein